MKSFQFLRILPHIIELSLIYFDTSSNKNKGQIRTWEEFTHISKTHGLNEHGGPSEDVLVVEGRTSTQLRHLILVEVDGQIGIGAGVEQQRRQVELFPLDGHVQRRLRAVVAVHVHLVDHKDGTQTLNQVARRVQVQCS